MRGRGSFQTPREVRYSIVKEQSNVVKYYTPSLEWTVNDLPSLRGRNRGRALFYSSLSRRNAEDITPRRCGPYSEDMPCCFVEVPKPRSTFGRRHGRIRPTKSAIVKILVGFQAMPARKPRCVIGQSVGFHVMRDQPAIARGDVPLQRLPMRRRCGPPALIPLPMSCSKAAKRNSSSYGWASHAVGRTLAGP